jgi:hypothetical protein
LTSTAAVLAGLCWAAASAPGQLGDAARLPVSAPELAVSGDTLTSRIPAPPVAESATVVTDKDAGARILRRTALRSSPGGKRVVSIGRATRFGGRQIVAVVARRGPWLGVLHQWMPNGKAGWIHERDAELMRIPWHIAVDRSDRTAVVRHEGSVWMRFHISVGRPGHETPLGRFAVSDRIVTQPGSVYGCCILALTGRQPKLPSGWSGGDRLAFHGTPDDQVGLARSAGCMHVRRKALRRLLRHVPVGTRVTIRA